VNYPFLENALSSLDLQEELAFHSRIIIEGDKSYHIPMIDFRCCEMTETDWDLMCEGLSSEILDDFYLFDSGSSFHGYSLCLLSEKEWMSFMLDLVILLDKLIDYRWVAHRIRGGHSSLRWSGNTKVMPRLLWKSRDANGFVALNYANRVLDMLA
jgi:hypothetical protein